ncbi:MAG TPA: PAS domain S-box protein [Deltaproteobacteria bacterium]|nr:PAS domain S-box protein [Deltaproteobacteria bacterium]
MQYSTTGQDNDFEILKLQEELRILRQALKESEEYSQSLFEQSHDIMYIHDFEGRFVDANNFALNLFGYTREEVTTLDLSSIVCREHLPIAREMIQELLETGIQQKPSVYQVQRRDGTTVWLETKTSLLSRDGIPYAVQGTARDITERKEAEDRLRQSEELYRTIFETAGTAVIIIEDDTTIHLANSNFQRLSGYSREELEDQMSWTEFIDPRDLERMKAYHRQRRLNQSSAPLEYEFHFVNKAGETRNILLNIDMIPGSRRSVASCMDITERIRAEVALRQSEQNYRNIIETIQEAYYEVDLSGNFTFFNSSVYKNLGYSDEELSGVNFRDYMDEADAAKVFEAYHQVYLTDEPVTALEFGARTKDGFVIPVEASISLRRDDSGKILGFKGVVRDITRRKEAEKAMRESEERYRLLAENSSDVICTLTLDGTFTYVSPAIKTFSGYSPEELIGRPFKEFLVPESYDHVWNILACELAKPSETRRSSGRFELKHYTKDMRAKDIEVTSSWVLGENGEPAGIQLSTRDITERKQSEEALRRSEERFRDLAEMLPETVYEADMNGRVTFVNKKGMEQFCINEDDLEEGITMHDVVSPSDYDKMHRNLALIFKGERTGLGEYTVIRKDQSTFPVLAHSTPIMKDGRAIGIRGFLVDITEKKNLESLLLQAQRMESIGTLAGGIAHDFNNLLMGILGNISLMTMSMDEKDTMYERLKNMEGYVKRGSDLTRQLLGFAQGGKYEAKVTDIGEFILNSTEMFSRTRKEIRVHTHVRSNISPVEVDQGQLEQVLLNLYLNAWQAMPGGGDLYVGAENTELTKKTAEIYGLALGSYVKVSVRDTGTGMDMSIKARIFDPFFTTKELGRGTGLGLASVYGIVKNHGGSIMVESEVGIGTEFVFFLPASSKPIEREVLAHDNINKGSGVLLLIDDEEMILNVGKDMMESLGYQVVSAQGGIAGLEEYKKRMEDVDLVILDMIMPDLGGRDVFVRLKEMNPGVRVILSSGYSMDGQAKEIMDHGCRGFIQKPFSLQNISRKIQEVLDGE